MLDQENDHHVNSQTQETHWESGQGQDSNCYLYTVHPHSNVGTRGSCRCLKSGIVNLGPVYISSWLLLYNYLCKWSYILLQKVYKNYYCIPYCGIIESFLNGTLPFLQTVVSESQSHIRSRNWEINVLWISIGMAALRILITQCPCWLSIYFAFKNTMFY